MTVQPPLKIPEGLAGGLFLGSAHTLASLAREFRVTYTLLPGRLSQLDFLIPRFPHLLIKKAAPSAFFKNITFFSLYPFLFSLTGSPEKTASIAGFFEGALAPRLSSISMRVFNGFNTGMSRMAFFATAPRVYKKIQDPDQYYPAPLSGAIGGVASHITERSIYQLKIAPSKGLLSIPSSVVKGTLRSSFIGAVTATALVWFHKFMHS